MRPNIARRFSVWLGFFVLVLSAFGCGRGEKPLAPRSQTWAELRTVRRSVLVTPPDEKERAPYPRERLVDGERVKVQAGGLAWLRRDAGATLLVRGPAELVLYADSLKLESGRIFIDSPAGPATEIETPSGKLQLAKVRASLDVTNGTTEAYVLDGEVRLGGATPARAGERLLAAQGAAAKVESVKVWEDWTGGLATTDPVAAPAPFGVGTVGARPPGELGAPRFPLAIQVLDVRVSIDGDFAVTEVDQRFFNPSSKVVEGIYRFRAPTGASIHRFGVDRGGELVWGRVKESAAAAAQYQSNVYAGSTEDPALLEWEGPGSYRARLYPIGPGEARRVVVRYTEWLPRNGEKGERRHYVYPMAAEGSEASLPSIEELTIKVDLAKARAKDVRVGMAGTRQGTELIVRGQDYTPRADLSVELFDEGISALGAYQSKHQPDLNVLAPDGRTEANKAALTEAGYVLVPLRATDIPTQAGGLDLAIVVDASAANDTSSMALARAAALGLLSHLGDDDRAVVWAGADALRPLLPDATGLVKIDSTLRQRYSAALASLERGGATDLGSMLTEAASRLDPARRGIVVYIGDGHATVGELSLKELEERMGKLPRPPRVFTIGVGRDVDLALLSGLANGGFAARVDDAHGAARNALAVLEHAERPAWLGTEVDLGGDVERIYPRGSSALVADETVVVVGRTSAATPRRIIVTTRDGKRELPLSPRALDDQGDLRRRWAEARLEELLKENSGRAAMVDVGTRFGIITPVTSYYVPTAKELAEERRMARSIEDREEEQVEETSADNKEGGTGTRAKGEEGSMGNPKGGSNRRYGVAGPADNRDPHIARQAALKDAAEFGMIGLLNTGAGGAPPPATDSLAKPTTAATAAASAATTPAAGEDLPAAEAPAPAAPSGRDDGKPAEKKVAGKAGNTWGDEIGDAYGAGGLGLSGVGEGGGGRGEGIGLGSVGALGHGAGTGTGQGFGSGHGRLGGAHAAQAPKLRMGAPQISGRLPPEVVQRIIRQNFGRFRLCYENGLKNNPNLQGRVAVKFVIDRQGAVANATNGGSDLPDASVVSCVVSSYTGLSFPQPEGGIVTVVYPIIFSPDGPAKPEPDPAPAPFIQIGIDVMPRFILRCSDAADLPLAERVTLWRERLTRVAGSPGGVLGVYQRALSGCEAPTWTERRRLLSIMLDALGNVQLRVGLWKLMKGDVTAADTLYRGIVARIKTAQQMRELHSALGLKSMDPGLLEKLLREAKSPADRAAKLRALSSEWPDDFKLALDLLDAEEDAGDFSGAGALAERLRARPGVDAHVRTAIGEYYLRRSLAEKDAKAKAEHEALARRAFGEIVEFSPDDPVARRRLGDLLRAHGWFADARRQYETLATLTPDDPSVALLQALAAQGEGQLEAAVRWTEKGRGAGAPDVDSGPAATARAFAATFLAWGRLDARQGKREEEVAQLLARAEQVLTSERAKSGSGARATLTWAHPELHPVLYTNALGSPMPAAEGDVTLGVAQARLPSKGDRWVEIRIEKDEVEAAARLGAEVVLTVVFDELGKGEKIVRLPVRFESGGPNTLRFNLGAGEVTRG
ncbi:MAG: AgmX/PglI C-terminal domain-containing protein [Myxococcales bacterium]|nr:AgmX/PglI C-terminal domain-containing protein [Myxococcales bacterium]